VVTGYNLGSETIAVLTEVFHVFPLSLHTNASLHHERIILHPLPLAVQCLPTI
jgi:hypothetical protein